MLIGTEIKKDFAKTTLVNTYFLTLEIIEL